MTQSHRAFGRTQTHPSMAAWFPNEARLEDGKTTTGAAANDPHQQRATSSTVFSITTSTGDAGDDRDPGASRRKIEAQESNPNHM